MKTVLITGCSSGFGLETARYFLQQGWRVVATMRTPRQDLLPASPNLTILPLDVTDADSIAAVVAAAGEVDALVNNAGIGMLGVLETTTLPAIDEVFATNTIGTIAMTRAFLPGMRARGAGAIVNVTSSTTLHPLPLLSVYTASKAAIEAFTASLALELAPFDIRAGVVIPGRAPDTSFRANAMARPRSDVPAPYQAFARSVMDAMSQPSPETRPSDVAEAVWRFVTDASAPARIPAGADAVAAALSRQAA